MKFWILDLQEVPLFRPILDEHGNPKVADMEHINKMAQPKPRDIVIEEAVVKKKKKTRKVKVNPTK